MILSPSNTVLNAIGSKRGVSNPELFTTSNAVSDSAENESNATTGFGQAGLDVGANIFASQNTAVNVGSYAIEGNSNDTPASAARFFIDLDTIPLTIGETYILSFDARHIGVGFTWVFRTSSTDGLAADAVTITTLSNTATTFQSFSHEFTYATTNRYFGARELSGANDGGVYFDNFSVKKK